MMENWQTALAQLSELNADLLLAGGDLIRDGSLHNIEFDRQQTRRCRWEATGRRDIQLSMH